MTSPPGADPAAAEAAARAPRIVFQPGTQGAPGDSAAAPRRSQGDVTAAAVAAAMSGRRLQSPLLSVPASRERSHGGLELEEFSQRLVALEERQDLAEALQRSGGQGDSVRAELERFRKLFEFVEGVLPKDAAKAMKFFTEDNSARGDEGQRREGYAQPEFDLNLHRERLQEQVDVHAADMRRELENLTTAIKALQRDFDHSRSRIGDLNGRVTGMEHEARMQRRMESTGSSVTSLHRDQLGGSGELRLATADGGSDRMDRSPLSAVAERSSPSSTPGTKSPSNGRVAGGEPRTKPDLAHLLEGESTSQGPLPFVSKKGLQQALEDLREDVRHWLDVLHASMISALQQKADQENLKDIIQKVGQATAVANDSIALFAKRSLTGKCASCDAPFSVDPSSLKKTPPVALERPWPPRGSPGAQVSIRPPQEVPRQLEGKAVAQLKDSNRLPKIQDRSGSRDFPKGKVLRNASQPELRSLRAEVQTPD